MKAFPAERGLGSLVSITILAYFTLFLVVSLFQTLSSSSEAYEKEKTNIKSICNTALEIADEMPVENKTGWVESFKDRPELIMLCSDTTGSTSRRPVESVSSIFEDLPLSVLF